MWKFQDYTLLVAAGVVAAVLGLNIEAVNRLAERIAVNADFIGIQNVDPDGRLTFQALTIGYGALSLLAALGTIGVMLIGRRFYKRIQDRTRQWRNERFFRKQNTFH